MAHWYSGVVVGPKREAVSVDSRREYKTKRAARMQPFNSIGELNLIMRQVQQDRPEQDRQVQGPGALRRVLRRQHLAQRLKGSSVKR